MPRRARIVTLALVFSLAADSAIAEAQSLLGRLSTLRE